MKTNLLKTVESQDEFGRHGISFSANTQSFSQKLHVDERVCSSTKLIADYSFVTSTRADFTLIGQCPKTLAFQTQKNIFHHAKWVMFFFTWTTYRRQERRLNAFHMRCLRSILGLSWKDRVFNTPVSANDWFLRPHNHHQTSTSTMGWSCVPDGEQPSSKASSI